MSGECNCNNCGCDRQKSCNTYCKCNCCGHKNKTYRETVRL